MKKEKKNQHFANIVSPRRNKITTNDDEEELKQRQSDKMTFSLFELLEYQKIRFKDANRYH